MQMLNRLLDAELDDQELDDELKDLENPGVEAKEEGEFS